MTDAGQMTNLRESTMWDDRLAFELALQLEGSGESINDILKRHNLDPQQLETISKDKLFVNKMKAFREEISLNGITFTMKAKAQAEELLKTSCGIIHSADTSPAVKADLIKSTVRWAGYENKAANDVGESTTGGVSIVINLGDDTPPNRVDAKVIDNNA